MRKFLWSIMLVLPINDISAQDQTFTSFTNEEMEQRTYILGLLDRQFNSPTQQKPTGTQQRIIAQVGRNANANDGDSTTYSYSGSNGSRFNYNLFLYNTFYTENYQPGYLPPTSVNMQPIYANNIQNVFADVITHYNSGEFKFREYCTYTQSNKISTVKTEYDTIYSIDSSRSILAYNDDGLCNAHYYSVWNIPDNADTNEITKSTFDNNQLLVDSLWLKENGFWALKGVTNHFYDVSGKPLVDSGYWDYGTGFLLSKCMQFSYYPDNKIQTVALTYFSGGNTIFRRQKDSLGYSNGVDYVTYWEHRDNTPSMPTASRIQRDIRYPGATGLPDSAKVFRQNYTSAWETSNYYHYNSFGNPEYISIAIAGYTTPPPHHIINFYYETYNDALSTADIKMSDAFRIYPNPFSDKLIISKTGISEKPTVKMFNVLGQEVLQAMFLPNQTEQIISTSGLNPGYYFLQFRDDNGSVSTKKVIKR